MIFIEEINLSSISEQNVNTSNFKMKFSEEKDSIIPYFPTRDEYIQFTKNTLVSNYFELYNNEIIIIPFSKIELNNLILASKVFLNTQRIPELYKDELNNIEKKIDNYIEKDKEYFCRLDSCSPKDAGILKIKSGIDVIRLILNSKRMFLRADDGIPEKLILRPWNNNIYNNSKQCEIRVFVYNSKITAISQYSPYNDYGLKRFNDSNLLLEIERQLEIILEKINKIMIKYTVNFSFDVFINDLENKISLEFIEINPFGMESPCGSCLFHWINDYQILYSNLNQSIPFRIITS